MRQTTNLEHVPIPQERNVLQLTSIFVVTTDRDARQHNRDCPIGVGFARGDSGGNRPGDHCGPGIAALDLCGDRSRLRGGGDGGALGCRPGAASRQPQSRGHGRSAAGVVLVPLVHPSDRLDRSADLGRARRRLSHERRLDQAPHQRSAWSDHPQGRAVAAEPLIHMVARDRVPARNANPPASRPLAGVRVLDLTRVLAGPVASRFLAGYGAEVLRIDPPDWNEPGVVPEVTLGKRCARLDLKTAEGRAAFEALLAQADIFLSGYRPGALDRLGYDAAARRAIAPGLIDVSLCAYGWSGPWAGRRGFDSLVLMSTGIAEAGMRWKSTDVPYPLPVQALDHTTGYLTAATAVRGFVHRLIRCEGMEAR